MLVVGADEPVAHSFGAQICLSKTLLNAICVLFINAGDAKIYEAFFAQ